MIIIILFLTFLVVVYWHLTRNFKYWAERGVKHDEPVFLFGDYIKGFLRQRSTAQIVTETYWKYPNEKVVGFYRFTKPELIVRDPEILKKVMVTDFQNFYSRNFFSTGGHLEPLLTNLFVSEGDIWKMLRVRMTPTFTSAKLKAMFPLIIERTEKLQARTADAAKSGKVVEAKDHMARYTIDCIGACGFGIDAKSLDDDNSAFRMLGRKFFDFRFKDAMIFFLKDMFPVTFKYFKYFGKVENDFRELVSEIQKARNYKQSGRNDFVDMLLEIKKQREVEIESIEKIRPDGSSEKVVLNFTDDMFLAQIMLFFGAGFQTSASSTSMALHLLAHHPEEQIKVQEEIDRALAKYDNKLSYDAIQEMTYLEMVFKEALRTLPSLGYLTRGCARKYTFEDLGFTIDKGIKILIPIQALNMDPKYWDRPEEFRPTRFLPEEAEKSKDVYMPFGAGPRNCIGSRLGQMQSLAGLAAILSKFTVKPAPTSVRHPKVNPKSELAQNVIGGLPVVFCERQ